MGHEFSFHPFNLLGLVGLLGIAFLFSRDKKNVNWRLVTVGVSLQFVLALIVLQPTVQTHVFKPIDSFVQALLGFSKQGADFVMQSVEKHDALEYIQVKQEDGTVKEQIKQQKLQSWHRK